MIAVIPQGAWHRFHSSEGVILMTAATPFPSEVIEIDVDDPRTAEPKKAIATGTPSIIDLNADSQS